MSDNFHTAMNQLSYANLLHHTGRQGGSVYALKTAKKYIDKLIEEIKDE